MKKSKHIIFSILIITYCLCLIYLTVNSKKNEDPQITTFIHYTVQPDDTLWDIAMSNEHEGMDIREFIYDLERMNGITPSIQPGTDILIPVYKE